MNDNGLTETTKIRWTISKDRDNKKSLVRRESPGFNQKEEMQKDVTLA